MAKRRKLETPADIERLIRQGRGQGEGSSYLPWIFVHEISSRGVSHKIPGLKINRDHHLLSGLEHDYFLILEFSHRVTDVREGYPLLPWTETVEIAGELGIKPPGYRTDSIHVPTTDFLVTALDATGKRLLFPRSTKYLEDLTNPKTGPRKKELLELERRYWIRRGRPWKLVTDHDIPPIVCANLRWLRPPPPSPVLPSFVEEQRTAFVEELVAWYTERRLLGEMVERAAGQAGLKRQEGILLFKQLTWFHEIQIDISVPIGLQSPLPFLSPRNPSATGGIRRAYP